MNEIKILHLFPRLLSLYGEYGNVSVLKKLLGDNGYSVSVDEYETDGDKMDSDYGFIYIGSGTEDNIKEALERIKPISEYIKKYISDGKPLLATGNGVAIFGKSVDGVDALSVFDFSTVTESKRYLGDILTDEKNVFRSNLVGFVNTSYKYDGATESETECIFGKTRNGLGVLTVKDGFYGTQLIGPFLSKNPHALEFFASAIAKQEIKINDENNIIKSYNSAITQLKNRTGEK